MYVVCRTYVEAVGVNVDVLCGSTRVLNFGVRCCWGLYVLTHDIRCGGGLYVFMDAFVGALLSEVKLARLLLLSVHIAFGDIHLGYSWNNDRSHPLYFPPLILRFPQPHLS